MLNLRRVNMVVVVVVYGNLCVALVGCVLRVTSEGQETK